MCDPFYFLDNCDDIMELAVDTSKKLSNLQKYSKIENDLKSMLWRNENQKIVPYFYGSRSYGLATDQSDLDIFVDVYDDGSKLELL